MTMLAAIIPAAGHSSRMGRCKPLLPFGPGTLLSHCVGLFRANGLDRIIVVTGNDRDAVAAEAARAGATPVHNAHFGQGMFSSVLTGLRALDPETAAFFLLPVDMPLVRPDTIARLADEYRRTKFAVLCPRFRGQRGHPPLISRSLLPEILAHDGTGGLRAVLLRHEATSLDLDDPGTVLDLNHPGDYQDALARLLPQVG
ncbi:nucleotidyltransferase family protein [Pseudodesulfovibrio pelocollis]|uniref:nucleotidyltransferase family protein n=1 Tax=Pseudodesulfovibrio pelocollis TaxID=3051432 RepID=UPI00255B012B|nr:nucleotidyltransferase family protein [Pseudodesulfovibrio sp. SB368]